MLLVNRYTDDDAYRSAIETVLTNDPAYRRNTPIGIQELWREWAKLHVLIEGGMLAGQTSRETLAVTTPKP